MKYCIFCGEEIPDNAVFCPSCGAKLPVEQTQNIPEDVDEDEDEEDSIELSILSKVNFESREVRTESIVPTAPIKKTEKKVQKVQPVKKEEEKKEPNIIQYVRKEQSAEKTTNIEKDSMQEDIQEDNLEIIEEDEIPVEDEMDKLFKSLDDFMEDKNVNVPDIVKEAISDENKEQKEPDKKEITEKKTDETISTKKNEEIPVKKENKKPVRAKVTYKKRNLLEKEKDEDDEDDIIMSQSKMKKDSSLNFNSINEDLTADEKADIEKYKNIKIEEEEDENISRKKGEGRKSNGRKKEARKNIDKEISKRKFNVIEHEEVEKKDDVDPDYDGYYENVKPIDFDKQRDNSSIIKVAITSIAFLALASLVFYLLITFFMK